MSNLKVDRATGATTTHGAAPVPEAAGRGAAGRGAAGRGSAGRGAAGRGATGRGAAGRGAAGRGAAGRGAAPGSPKSRSPSPYEFDPKPGVPNKQTKWSNSSGNKGSELPASTNAELSEKGGVENISTKKKRNPLPDPHNLSSASSKQSFLNSQFKLEANLIKSKNPPKFLEKKSVVTIDRETKSSILQELGNRLLMIEKIDTNNIINCEELMLQYG
jgi:hypothetical protein